MYSTVLTSSLILICSPIKLIFSSDIPSSKKTEIVTVTILDYIDDVKRLTKMNLYGAIIGKAYYTGAIDLSEAIEVAK